jgi:hypothetical protein
VQVINAKTGREIWVPRQHIGAVSDAGNALLTVGLRKPLDLRSGSLEPRVKRVIEMPLEATEQFPSRNSAPHPAPVVAIRLDDNRKSAASKAIVGLAIGSLLACLLASAIATVARL